MLLDDLSSTKMTLPSFYNTGDYITHKPCWTGQQTDVFGRV